MSVCLSVVIPVHNGAKCLKRTVDGILNQSFRDLEVILVENGSKDNTLEICRELAQKDDRVRCFQNACAGTSLARKRGVQEALGQYIVFSDQDDSYIDRYSLEKMVAAIREDDVQICQFGFYKKYAAGIKRKITGKRGCYSKEELLQSEIIGVIGCPNRVFNCVVWNKIYQACVLKSAVKHVDIPLVYAEDMNLNLYAFFDETVFRVSSREESYYVWDANGGFSSDNRHACVLFEEYRHVKPATVKLLTEHSCTEEMFWQCHVEAIYFYKSLIQGMIQRKIDKKTCVNQIEIYETYNFVVAAKAFLRQAPSEKMWEELTFLAGEYTPEDYYEHCAKTMPKITLKRIVGRLIRLGK